MMQILAVVIVTCSAVLGDQAALERVRRVIDGEDVKNPGWMAFLENPNSPFASKLWCGGTLINRCYILTAGHCFKKEDMTDWNVDKIRLCVTDQSKIATDKNVLTYNKAPAAGKTFTRTIHDKFKYVGRIPIFDVALVRLSECVPESKIPMPMAVSKPPKGCNVTVYGWASGDPLLKKRSDQVDSCTKEKNGNAVCTLSTVTPEITHRGDSGGPWTAKDADGKECLVGVMRSGQLNVYDDFTSISEGDDVRKWILDNITACDDCNSTIRNCTPMWNITMPPEPTIIPSEPPVDPSEEPPVDPSEEPPVDPSEEPPVDPSEEPPVDPSEEPPVDPPGIWECPTTWGYYPDPTSKCHFYQCDWGRAHRHRCASGTSWVQWPNQNAGACNHDPDCP